MKYLKQEIIDFTSSNITESVLTWNADIITAGSFIVGVSYTITSLGTTNFTLIGAATNTVGVVFTATGVGAGTGTAQTTYKVGDYALIGTYIYKSVSAHTNKSPLLFEGVYWVKWQVSNRYSMLDLSSQSKSNYAGNMVVEFLQNRMEAIAIGNYDADTVKFEILDTDSTTVLWTYTIPSTINANVIDYYSYIYSSYGYTMDKARMVNLPLWGYKVRVTFNKSTESTTSNCGFLVGGTPIYMGKTLSNVKFGFHSYAIKNTDSFGSLTITKRAVQDLVDFETTINTNDIQNMKREIKKVYNDIICFVVEDESDYYENLITLGAIESASVVLSEFDKTIMTFSIIEAI